jgi:hypothetical protein
MHFGELHPAEIIKFLLESYQSLYPDHVFNWTMMVETMGRCDTPKESIENLLSAKQVHFPSQPIDWDHLLDEFASSSLHSSFSGLLFQERLQFLVMCGMSARVEALPFKVWNDHITSMIHTAAFVYGGDNTVILRRIQAKVAHFEEEYPKLKEAASILELALWKNRLDESGHKRQRNHCKKKMRTDESEIRRQCRITGGADIVIRHILPYLINAADEESDSESDANDLVDDNESSDSE